MKTIGLSIVLLLVIWQATAQQITWTKKTSLPAKCSKCSAATVNGKIYVMGGSPASSGYFSKACYEYTPESDSWTRKADLPTGRINFAIAVVGNKIYVIGGDPFSDKVDVYDPATDTWSEAPNMPTKRQHVNCAVADNKIYVIGGLEDVSCPVFPNLCNYDTSTRISSKNEVFDPETGTWLELALMPNPRHGMQECVINSKIYVLGGMGDSASMWNSLKSVEAYNPATNTWETIGEMPIARDGFGYSQQGNQIMITGGWCNTTSSSGLRSETYLFNPDSCSWIKSTDLPVKRGSFAFATIGKRFYLIGGENASSSSQYADVYEGEFSGNTYSLSYRKKNRYTLFPNPTKGTITLIPTGIIHGDALVSVVSATGEEVFRTCFRGSGPLNIDLTDLLPGLYSVQVQNGDYSFKDKIIKQP